MAARRCGSRARATVSWGHPRDNLERELTGETEHARVHVRRRRQPAGDIWQVRRVVEKGGVAVRYVVDVEPRREAPTTQANDLLEAQVHLSVALAVQRAPAVQRAGGYQVHREWTACQRATDLACNRGPILIGRYEREGRGYRTSELVGTGVVRGSVEDRTVPIDAADQDVDLRKDVSRQPVERGLDRRLGMAVRVQQRARAQKRVLWNRRTNRAPVVDHLARARAAGEGEAFDVAEVERHVDAVKHARIVADILRRLDQQVRWPCERRRGQVVQRPYLVAAAARQTRVDRRGQVKRSQIVRSDVEILGHGPARRVLRERPTVVPDVDRRVREEFL